jgi:hypothetical protein
MDQTVKPAVPTLLRGKKAAQVVWKPILLQWLLPGLGYWILGERGRAKAFFAVWAVFLALGALQLQFGAVDGIRGGIYVLTPGSWLQSLSALGTAGIGPLYGAFAWAFGGTGAEPVRNLTQEYGATYVMVAGLLNWLCCFDLFDRATGRWHWRLPKDERIGLGMEEAEKPEA